MLDWSAGKIDSKVGKNIVSLNDASLLVNDYSERGKTIGCTSLPGDILHPGHITCLFEAQKLCDVLFIIVNDDGFLRRKKGLECIPHKERCQIISSIKGVDYVVPFTPSDNEDQTVCEALKALCPDYFFKGGDRSDEKSIPEWNTCKLYGIQIVTGVGDTKTLSSSALLDSYFRRRLLMEIRNS